MKQRLLTIVFALLLIACALVFGACGDKGETVSGPRMYQVDGILKEASTPWKMPPEADTYEYGMRGYDLLGVYDNDGNLLFDANGKRVDGAMLEQDMVLVEHYKSKPLSLSFDAGVGRFDNGDSEITEAAHYNEPLAERALPIPTHPDPSYAFDGWFIKGSDIRFSQGGTAVEKNLNALTFETVLSENGLALEAVYFQKKVSLTVDFDNSEIPSVTTVFPYGTAMPDLSEYLHDDGRWAIAGWSLSATAQIAIPDTLTEDVTVFAVWEEYRTAELVYPAGERRTVRLSVKEGSVTLPTANEVPGYSFFGWYTTSALSGNTVTFLSVDALSPVYYGDFRLAGYSLHLTVDGEPFGDPISYYYGDTVPLPVPEKIGYTFVGYTFEGNEIPFTSIPKTLYGDKVLSAVFEAKKYPLTFRLDGGILPSADHSVTYGSHFAAPVPVKYGYSFLGWYSTPAGEGVRYTSAAGQSLECWSTDGGGVFYARYARSTYTVIYRVDGVTYKTQQYTHGEALAFTAPPTKNGVHFAGWFGADGTREYTERSLVTSDTVLDALWLESIPIATPEELVAIKDAPNASYHLTNDINLAGATFTPIPEFSGTLDGGGYKIYNLALTANASGAGSCLLGIVANNAGTIKNLTVADAVIGCSYSVRNTNTLSVFVGVIAAKSTGVITNCTARDITVQLNGFLYPHSDTCTATVNAYFGGIAGEIGGAALVNACHSDVALQSILTQNQIGTDGGRKCEGYGGIYIGGITGKIGTATAVVEACTAKGRLESLTRFEGSSYGGVVHAYNYVAGIAAQNRGTVLDCYSYGKVAAKSTDELEHELYHGGGTYVRGVETYVSAFTGGIVTENYGTVRSCLSAADCGSSAESGENSGGGYSKVVRVGGIVAVNRENALVENVRSLAAITALEGNDRASGGLVGYNEGRVRASVSLGTVYSRGTAGGFVGVNALTGTVMNSLSFTDVEYADFSGDTGIFVAENDGLMQGCAYDAANSCKKENIDVGRITVSGVAEKSEGAILARDHILYELGFEDSTWQITDGKMPTLHFEMLYFDALI